MRKQYNHFKQIIRNFKIWINTFLNKGRFAYWGAGSKLECNAKLVCPYLIKVGENVVICEHVWLNANDSRSISSPTLTIGNGSYIGRFCHINAWSDVVIEENVLIADRVFISDADHFYSSTSLPIILQGDYFKAPVRLKKGCWIGTGAVILPGITIGQNAVIGANSVVTKDIPDFTVAAGVPAQILKNLK